MCLSLYLQSGVARRRDGGVMKITVGSEEARLLGKACKCFSSNPPRVNDLNRVAGCKQSARGARMDQAVGLCYREGA